MTAAIEVEPETARARYEAALSDVPPRRRWGIRYAKTFFLIGALVLLLFLVAMFWQVFTVPYSSISQAEWNTRILAIILLLGLFANFLWRRVNPQHHTVRHTFRNYPKVRETVKRCRVFPEVFRKYLPTLEVGGRTFFIADYRMRHDPQFQVETSSLLLDTEGRVISDEALFARVFATLTLGHATSFGTQAYVEAERKILRKTERRVLPKWHRALRSNQRRFEELGADDKLRTILEKWQWVIRGGRERDRFWDYEQKCVRSQGYGFALTIHEEDALRLKEAELAFADLIEAEFYKPALEVTFAAAELWSLMENQTGWRRRRALRNALYFLKNYQAALREAISTFRQRSEPSERTWRAFREGLALARRLGVTVVDGRALSLAAAPLPEPAGP